MLKLKTSLMILSKTALTYHLMNGLLMEQLSTQDQRIRLILELLKNPKNTRIAHRTAARN